MIRSFLKARTIDLAVEGLTRVLLNEVQNNPGKRAYQLGLIAFGSGPNDMDCPDHKNMLTWAALCELERRGDIVRNYPINWAAMTDDQHQLFDYYMNVELCDIPKGAPSYFEFIESLPKKRSAEFFALV